MFEPKRIYELLLDACSSAAVVDDVLIGLVWTLCRNSDNGVGLAMSPGVQTRTLPWPGALQGKPIIDLAAWIMQWDPYQATVGMAAINSCLNNRPLPDSVAIAHEGEQANLAVFDHFLPHLLGKKVVVVGHYPGIERYRHLMRLSVLELQPSGDDLPAAAAEFLLPHAEWVFLTASSIPNKTFPRLAELAADARTVLMGPTAPWLPQLHEFGIDYLAGVEVIDAEILRHTAAQGGGVRLFEHGLRYRVAELTPAANMQWLKRQIADCAEEKRQLSQEMEAWYAGGSGKRFPKYTQLERVNTRLSRLDSSYKPLWDHHGAAAGGTPCPN